MERAIAEHFGADFATAIGFSVSQDTVERFATLTGDRSSLHVDEDFARVSVYRKRVAHGMLPVAYLGLVDGLRVDGFVCRPKRIQGHFIEPVFPGDRLNLVVEIAAEQAGDSELALDYRVEKPLTDSVVTKGTLVVGYEKSPAAPAAEGGGPATIVTEPGPMRALQIDDVARGDETRLDLAVSAGAVEAMLDCLRSGIEAAGEPAGGDFDHATLLAVLAFSTLVGMRLPGESATFLEFTADVAEPVRIGADYGLAGTVTHASRATSILKTRVSVAPAGGGEAAIEGKVVALVNPPRRPIRTIADLKASALDPGLRDKVVLITGASRGIGETMAKLFALVGSKVVVNYRRGQADAERIVKEIVDEGGTAIAVRADVTDSEQVREMVRTAVDRFGGVDVLVNNAVRDFRSIAYDDLGWDEMQGDLDVTVKGAFNCCKAVTPHMLERGGGKIVNVSSVYADDPPPDQLKYVVSKAALDGLTRGLSVEFAERNIQVNAVVPSFVDTDIASHIYDAIRSKKAQESPMKRNATPEDVAQAVVFLASSFSSYMTGQRVMVTGGGAPYS